MTDRASLPLLVLRPLARTAPPSAPNMVSDEQLILRAEAGDLFAVELLFERFSDLVLGIGLKVLRDRGEAEDFVQDFFLALFHKMKGFDPAKGSARTWIVQIAYRRAFDRHAYLSKRESTGRDQRGIRDGRTEGWKQEANKQAVSAGLPTYRAAKPSVAAVALALLS